MSDGTNPLPREIAPGVTWLGDCIELHYAGTVLHGYNSLFLVCGETCSALVETGHPQRLAEGERQLEALLDAGAPPLRYVLTTHQEPPHSAGIGRLLDRYPDAVACGAMHDFHLVFPEHADRFRWLDAGDELDLGGRTLRVVEALLRDYRTSLWFFDTGAAVLFPGDGFAYSHYHRAGHCGRLAEEAPDLSVTDMTALFAELALYWTRFTDMEPYIERLERQLDELGVRCIAPTHGLPITDLEQTLPAVTEGLRAGSTGRVS